MFSEFPSPAKSPLAKVYEEQILRQLPPELYPRAHAAEVAFASDDQDLEIVMNSLLQQPAQPVMVLAAEKILRLRGIRSKHRRMLETILAYPNARPISCDQERGLLEEIQTAYDRPRYSPPSETPPFVFIRGLFIDVDALVRSQKKMDSAKIESIALQHRIQPSLWTAGDVDTLYNYMELDESLHICRKQDCAGLKVLAAYGGDLSKLREHYGISVQQMIPH